MPHGDFSDYAALFCLGTGISSMYSPSSVYSLTLGPVPAEVAGVQLGPAAGFTVKPLFDAAGSAEVDALVQFAGGLLVCMGIVLFVNRWNT